MPEPAAAAAEAVPDAKAAIPLIVGALRDVFGEALTCAILKGSVRNGDLITYFSDLDIHAFVRGIGPARTPSWPQAVAFQARIGALDPEAYGVHAFQVSFADAAAYPEEWVPPLPGTYDILTGTPPAAFARVEPGAYLAHAGRNLAALAGWTAALTRSYVDKPDAALPRLVRLAGTYLKGALYDVAILVRGDPQAVLTASLPHLVELVGAAAGCREPLDHFYGRAAAWRQVRTEPADLREMFAAGMTALDAIMRWNGAR